MSTSIELDEHLVAEAMELGGLPTGKAAVERALKEFVRVRRQLRAVDRLEGVGWTGDLDVMRDDAKPESDRSMQAGE